ncbi:hypothetical protein [Bradyrhizobium lablabi]|uniref:hypothetical protein n=1 Tax=Bradyrhizobium lablabi TaxID=722472 RepID=UPI001BA9CDBD|nr:hypothetical protein [Bradyrhizobium lablabi]MBR0693683.1 hypothetical protein [Bradyrhizobium lablabi]
MSIPANIATEIGSLQQQVAEAVPLAQASHATVTALQLNAGNLVNDIQSALTATSTLDTWVPPVDAPSMVIGFDAVVTAAEDQANLSLMRGVVGRVSANLNQLS